MQLIIETSSEYSLLALEDHGKIAASSIQQHGNQLSSSLLPDIQALLDAADLTIEQLTGIYVGVGPGSYTGTRVGVAVAKTLSFALNIPLTPFCSLLASLPNMIGSFACTMPSRTGEIFILKGECTEDTLSLSTSLLMSRSAAIETLRGVETCVGAPLEEIGGPWIAPQPGFDSILKWLTHRTLTHSDDPAPPADLIYLHTP